jgi:hypothetical protein
MSIRKAITIFDEDTAMTLLKPHSKEYDNMLFVIYEDAYGEINGKLKSINDVKALFNGTSEEFDVILSQL